MPVLADVGFESMSQSWQYTSDADDFGVAELVPQYLDLCRHDLAMLHAALQRHDFEQIRVVGHNLKGSGGAYGFPGLSSIGARVESAASAADEAVLREGVTTLELFF